MPRLALPTSSNPHQIYAASAGVSLFPVAAAPFSVNVGQEGVVPLALTFVNPGDGDVSAADLTRIRIRLESETGVGLIPSDVLSKISIREGVDVYVEETSLPTSGDSIDLLLDPHVRVTPLEPVTINVALGISPATTVPSFRVALIGATDVSVEDENSAIPLPLTLGEGSFPVRSGLATVLAGATQLDVTSAGSSDVRAGQGQTAVPLLSMALQSAGVDGVTSDVVVERIAIAFQDDRGAPLSDPGAALGRLQVLGPAGVAADVILPPGSQSLVNVDLSPPILVPVNVPTAMTVTADVREDAPVGNLRAALMTGAVTAMDATQREPVAVQINPVPLVGGTVTIESVADELRVAGEPLFPATVTVGSAGVEAVALDLRHPGGVGVGRIRCQRLTVGTLDGTRSEVAVSTFVSRIDVRQAGSDLVSAAVAPGPATSLALDVGPIDLEPGESTRLIVSLDTAPTAPSQALELIVAADGLVCTDANTDAGVTALAEAGQSFPLSSGLTLLAPPARQLEVSLESLMPATLAPGGDGVRAGRLRLSNPAEDDAGAIYLDHVALDASSPVGAGIPFGDVVRRVWVYSQDLLLSASDSLSADSTRVLVSLQPPVAVPAGGEVELEVRLDLSASPAASRFRVGVDDVGIGVVQPGGALLAVAVSPAAGLTFPLWTEAGGFTPEELAESFSNFPNPFAAGTQPTTFAYYLDSDAEVTLRVYTADGDRVVTLIGGESRPGGAHEEVPWDGRNGVGKVVRNGIYLAQLLVDYRDGRSEKVLRKVLVVR